MTLGDLRLVSSQIKGEFYMETASNTSHRVNEIICTYAWSIYLLIQFYYHRNGTIQGVPTNQFTLSTGFPSPSSTLQWSLDSAGHLPSSPTLIHLLSHMLLLPCLDKSSVCWLAIASVYKFIREQEPWHRVHALQMNMLYCNCTWR